MFSWQVRGSKCKQKMSDKLLGGWGAVNDAEDKQTSELWTML